MDLDERERLHSCEKEFVKNVKNFSKLLDLLVEKNVLSKDIKSIILKDKNEFEQKSELIFTLPKRGPSAYKMFVDCLRASENADLVQLLEKLKVVYYNGETVRKAPYKMDFNSERCYRMRSKPKGLALIVNIYNFKDDTHPVREGSCLDVQNLEKLWVGLGYEVTIKKNPTAKELTEIIKDFSRKPELKDVDSCVVMVMSHGKSSQCIQGVDIICHDNRLVYSQMLVRQFHEDLCQNLVEKPKLFFFQACRGEMTNKGVVLSAENLAASSSSKKLNQISSDLEYQRSTSAPTNSNLQSLIFRDISDCGCPRFFTNESETSLNNHLENNVENGTSLESEEDSDTVANGFCPEVEEVNNNAIDHESESDMQIVLDSIPRSLEESNSQDELLNGEDKNLENKGRNSSIKIFRQDSMEKLEINDVDDVVPSNLVRPVSTDILIVYSAYPGYLSMRHPNKGSYFMQEVFKVFSENAYKMHLIEMLNKVQRNMEQISTPYGFPLIQYENMHFKKSLYFNPGLYD